MLRESELSLILPHVVRTGTAGLAWRNIRGTALASTEPGRKLRTARRVQAVHDAIREAEMIRLLYDEELARCEPIVVKGWGCARRYPETSLRPYTDIDVFVSPNKVETAKQAAASASARGRHLSVSVDVQTAWQNLLERTWTEIYRHSRVAPLLGHPVRILGPEDSLRLACFHLLRHFGFNPLWFCDVAIMVESIPSDFDWDYCVSGSRRRVQWMFVVIRLAERLLGARLNGCATTILETKAPAWMATSVLQRWGGDGPYPHPLGAVINGDLRETWHALTARWPNRVEALWRLAWPINRISGLTAQPVDYLLRSWAWIPRHLSARTSRVTSG